MSVRDSSSDNRQVNVKELYKWEPATTRKMTSKVESITAAVPLSPITTASNET